ncbi:hypothetical protein L2D08_03525 [Domibacillus sp. PGB-M46]|uniref:hypothetical protein n=1 Tax=Domibacillus sp. PGB-M46 TaxID=2910255 RepID=UPI001F570B67|nr:hypothetical protein [Domibacillus sp. PGB-M46]MCI2253431.1 hypothetical protein [Domibacillus sp. PGB-M46]
MTKYEIIENPKLREELASRIEVLDKIGNLLILPGKEYATAQQIANFYEVPLSHLNVIYFQFYQELLTDGLINLKSQEVKKMKAELQHVVALEEIGLGKSVSNVNLYSKRAILRFGMLLRDSGVAKEVRTQLMKIEEKASDVIKAADITEEVKIQMAIGKAASIQRSKPEKEQPVYTCAPLEITDPKKGTPRGRKGDPTRKSPLEKLFTIFYRLPVSEFIFPFVSNTRKDKRRNEK